MAESIDDQASPMETKQSSGRTPVTVLAGALGAGKTTLLKYILERPHGFRVAVIQNEFSDEMGIESPLIMDANGEAFKDIVELPNGCLCCSAKDGLLVALDKLLEDQQRFDYVLVEATGVADPESICEIFWVDDGLGCRVYLDGVVTLVDGHNALSSLGVKGSSGDAGSLGLEEEVAKQIACADVLVLNKADLAAGEERGRIAKCLREMNPVAKLLESTYAEVPLDSILGICAFDRSRVASALGDLGHEGGHADEDVGHGLESNPSECHAVGVQGARDHRQEGVLAPKFILGHGGVESFLLRGELSALYDPDKVEAWIANVLWEGAGGGVYRCKGLFAGPMSSDDDTGKERSIDEVNAYALQGVGKIFEIEEAPGVSVSVSKFLFVGRDLQRKALVKGLRRCISIDLPEEAAVTAA